jgi:hypothetical protein
LTDSVCCSPTCAEHKCSPGLKADLSKADDQTVDDEHCCQKTCAKYSCQGEGLVLDPDRSSSINLIDDVCCRRTCAVHDCPKGSASIPSKKDDTFYDRCKLLPT